MLRIWVCATHMGGFWVQNSLSKGPHLVRFFLSMSGVFEKLAKLSKMGNFPPKFIVKVCMAATDGN